MPRGVICALLVHLAFPVLFCGLCNKGDEEKARIEFFLQVGINPVKNTSGKWNCDIEDPRQVLGLQCVAGCTTTIQIFGVLDASGTFPTIIGQLTRLTYLGILKTNIHGTIPTEIGNLRALQQLQLAENPFTGTIPTEMGKLTLLTTLVLSQLTLTGTLPTEFASMKRLTFFQADSCQLSGTFPMWVFNLPKLYLLFLNGNNFAGTLPTTIGQLQMAVHISLAEAGLTGTIPTEIGQLPILQTISLTGNSLSGTIPTELWGALSLRTLSLDSNELIGTLPQLIDLPQLYQLKLDNNYLNGTIPESLFRSTALNFLSLSNQPLSGTFPRALGNLLNLRFLLFSGTYLGGRLYLPLNTACDGVAVTPITICYRCCRLRMIPTITPTLPPTSTQTLTSTTVYTGTQSLTSTSVTTTTLTATRIQLPRNGTPTFTPSMTHTASYTGTPTARLSSTQIVTNTVTASLTVTAEVTTIPFPRPQAPSGRKDAIPLYLIILMIVVIALLIVIAVLAILAWRGKLRRNVTEKCPEIAEGTFSFATTSTFPTLDMLSGSSESEHLTISDGNSAEHLTVDLRKAIGSGGQASVFKGLSSHYGIVAVKRIPNVHQRHAEILSEISLLKKLHHPNVVGFKGSIIKEDYVYIVMEYVGGGSLETILESFGAMETEQAIRIVRNILQGLSAVHRIGIVHRDIKPGNVLLSVHGVCKLADFGVAVGNGNDSTVQMAGTLHYMSPEAVVEKPQYKSDIWAVGLILIELLTKEKPWGSNDVFHKLLSMKSYPIPKSIQDPRLLRVLPSFLQWEPHNRLGADDLLLLLEQEFPRRTSR